MTRLEQVVSPTGRVDSGSGNAYLISPKTNNSFVAVNRILEKGGEVHRSKESFAAGGNTSYPPGTFIIDSSSVSRSLMTELAEDLFLTIGRGNGRIGETYELTAPRIALYNSWTASADEGWTRWLFEQYEFPFTRVQDAEIRAGELGKKFDVLVLPSLTPQAIVEGRATGTIPPRYVGGITDAGVRNIEKFVEEGGTLVTMRGSCNFAMDVLEIPVTDALTGLRPPRRRSGPATRASEVQFACPGSILRMNFDPEHPVTYGMPEEAPAMFYRSTAFNIASSFDGNTPKVISKYPRKSLLMSGYIKGEEHLQGKAAAVDVPLGKGRVIMLGFGVKQRAQPHGTFKLLFNSLYYGASR